MMLSFCTRGVRGHDSSQLHFRTYFHEKSLNPDNDACIIMLPMQSYFCPFYSYSFFSSFFPFFVSFIFSFKLSFFRSPLIHSFVITFSFLLSFHFVYFLLPSHFSLCSFSRYPFVVFFNVSLTNSLCVINRDVQGCCGGGAERYPKAVQHQGQSGQHLTRPAV